MKKILFSVPFFLIFSLFIFTAFTNSAAAQTGRVSIELKPQMSAGDLRGDGNAKALRPRIYQTASFSAKSKTEQFDNNLRTAVYMPSSGASLEKRVFELINQKRREYGLQPVVWSDDVARVARLHSQNMANLNFFSHQGADGKRVSDRADSLGVRKWRSLGENIAYNRGYGSPLESAVQSWMNSPGHRDNILNGGWEKSGVGIAVTAEGTYYFTQVFLKN